MNEGLEKLTKELEELEKRKNKLISDANIAATAGDRGLALSLRLEETQIISPKIEEIIRKIQEYKDPGTPLRP